MDFFDAIKVRRSVYVTGKDCPVTDKRIIEIIKEIANISPSSFNSQSTRVVVLFNKESDDFWKIVLETLRKVAPTENFGETEAKINMFANSHGTILYYEDMDVVKGLQESFPLYADNFPGWSREGNAMLIFQVWTALAIEGIGATLQHYNPIIDEEVAKRFSIPASWKLYGQMPFGSIVVAPDEKDSIPVEQKVFIKQ